MMKARILNIALYLLFFSLTGCAGYRFNMNNNPLIGYDIRSISVPMFINRTNIPALSTYLSKEIILALNDYTGLKVYGGDNADADAVLIGVLESNDLHNKTYLPSDYQFTDANLKDTIGNRPPFYYPTKTNYSFNLRLIIVKRPTASEIELLTSEIGKSVTIGPKIVLNESLGVTGNFSRAVGGITSTNTAGEVNFTKNKGLEIKSLQDVAISTANTFKQVILNAF